MREEDDEFLTVAEAARRLQVSPTTVRNWAADGRLPEHRTLGGHRRFRARDVDELVRDTLPSRRRTVLVVDDDPAIRFVVREAFNAMEFEVVEAGSGLLGLDALDESPPSLILLDIMMPSVDGFQVMKYLDQHGVDVPVLAFSAAGETVAERARRLGADDFIEKPFDLRDLLNRATALIEAAEARRADADES